MAAIRSSKCRAWRASSASIPFTTREVSQTKKAFDCYGEKENRREGDKKTLCCTKGVNKGYSAEESSLHRFQIRPHLLLPALEVGWKKLG